MWLGKHVRLWAIFDLSAVPAATWFREREKKIFFSFSTSIGNVEQDKICLLLHFFALLFCVPFGIFCSWDVRWTFFFFFFLVVARTCPIIITFWKLQNTQTNLQLSNNFVSDFGFEFEFQHFHFDFEYFTSQSGAEILVLRNFYSMFWTFFSVFASTLRRNFSTSLQFLTVPGF